MAKNYKTILQEDDCAPDAFEYFEEKFIKEVGMSVKDFKDKSKMTDCGDTFIYEFGNYKLINEIGNHTLKKDLSDKIKQWKDNKRTGII